MIRIRVSMTDPLEPQLSRAVDAIRRGQVVAFPTDTLYGLAADPRDDAALAALFAVKGRAAERTVALVAADLSQAESLVELGGVARRLADEFWPGPLTLVVPVWSVVSRGAASASQLVGIRVPDHPVARALAAACEHPLTSTSANRSGRPATADPDVVAAELPSIAVLVDAGIAPGGLPSTVVDASTAEVRLLREGALPWSRVLEFLSASSHSA